MLSMLWSLVKLLQKLKLNSIQTKSWKRSGAETQMPTIKNIEGKIIFRRSSSEDGLGRFLRKTQHLASLGISGEVIEDRIMNQSRWNSVCWICWTSHYYRNPELHLPVSKLESVFWAISDVIEIKPKNVFFHHIVT